jgi:hypothetical protein
MFERLMGFAREQTRGIRLKIHTFSLGMAVALAAPLLAQGCAAGGQ